MAKTAIEQNMQGFSGDAEEMEAAVVKLQKNLSWLLEHLDSDNVRAINTSRTTVSSEDGATTINGAEIIMEDSAGTVRARLGKDADGIFRFEIYDADGTETIRLSENGSAVFSGNIEGADIEGANIRIAPNTFRDYIALENDGTEDTIGMYYGGTRVGGLRLLDAGGIELFGHNISIGSSAGTVSIAPGATGTFTAGNKNITVQKGIITAIE